MDETPTILGIFNYSLEELEDTSKIILKLMLIVKI